MRVHHLSRATRRTTRRRRLGLAAGAVVLAAASVAVPDLAATAAEGDNATFVSQAAPPSAFCGQQLTVTVTMRNSGTSTWTSAAGYVLRAQDPPGTTRWGTATAAMPTTVAAVAPSGSVRFSFPVTAPATAGVYAFQWRMSVGGVDFGAYTPSVQVPVTCSVDKGYRSGFRAVSGDLLSRLFLGTAHIEADTAFSTPARGHAETTTVYYGGRYLMFYKQTDPALLADGCASPEPNHHAIAMATSADGTTWTAHNGGQPVFAIPGDHVYAPNVIIDKDGAGRPRLTMVFERNPGCNSVHQRVARVQSYDGLTWGASVDLVAADETYPYDWNKNTGTPHLVRTPDNVYRVGYHGFSGTDGDNAFRVGYASGTTINGLLPNLTGPIIGNDKTYRPGNWAKVGPGRTDVVKEGQYWYMLMEGLRGSANCNASEISSWALARTNDATLATGWTFSAYNPVRTDRVSRRCGEDMPSFQVVDGMPYFVTTNKQTFADLTTSTGSNLPLQRYRIVSGARGQLAASERVVAVAPAPDGRGYYEVTGKGAVYAYGSATFHGSVAGTLNAPIVGMAVTPGGGGYWLVASDGGVFAYGNAGFHGSAGNLPLVKPIVGMSATPNGGGYWLVASDGGIFAYGNAAFHGSLGGTTLVKPIVGMASTSDGGGYWLVAADGGIFAYGNAAFHGSTGGWANPPVVVGMARTATNGGYWLLLENGGVYTFGDAPYLGSSGGGLAETSAFGPATAVGMAAMPAGTGAGYWIAFKDGGILENGAAGYYHEPAFAGV